MGEFYRDKERGSEGEGVGEHGWVTEWNRER
jgi:hypothetical protein